MEQVRGAIQVRDDTAKASLLLFVSRLSYWRLRVRMVHASA